MNATFNDTTSVVKSGGSGMLEVASSRQAQEVQAAMVVAKKCPRDENESYARIMRACKRKGLAENACYTYPRGNTTVEGPSIRLAEVLAQNWGNIDFGIVELEQKNGESVVMAYAWDLETNTRQTKVFTVKHIRYTRNGSKSLNDPRDIYEMTANQGARRLRACILGIIPGDIQEEAVRACNDTLASSGGDIPLQDRVRKMTAKFDEMGVSVDMIETRLGHKIETITEQELIALRKIYKSCTDNFAGVGDYFEQPSKSATGARKALEDRREKKQLENSGTEEKPTESEEDNQKTPESYAKLSAWFDDHEDLVNEMCSKVGLPPFLDITKDVFTEEGIKLLDRASAKMAKAISEGA